MASYYILSLDSFADAFSYANTGRDIHFKYKSADVDNSLGVLRQGDLVLVYHKKPMGKANILLEVTDGLAFKKKLEIDGGTDLSEFSLDNNPEDVMLQSISPEVYDAIIKKMLSADYLNGRGGEYDFEKLPRQTGAENILLYGVPGAGKSHKIARDYCNDANRMERVVFHPDYTYSDFVGQILPRVIDGQLKYEFTPGPFTKILDKAWKDPGNYYYLVIEELNRGNAPAIFGEIFQLLDRKDAESYPPGVTGESEYEITNFEVAECIFKDSAHKIRIPSNMYVLATMNTADQNVFTLDTAFQRRWKMEHIPNKFSFEERSHSLDMIEGTDINWGSFATVINEQIMDTNKDISSSEDKRLGTYFVKKKDLNPKDFPEKVLKYLWDDAFKLDKEAVFKDDLGSLEDVIDVYEQSPKDKLQFVLRTDLYKTMLERMQDKKDVSSNEEDGN